MSHLLIPSIIGGLSLPVLIVVLIFALSARTHPISDAIGNLLLHLYCSLSGSLLIFAALPEYSFIIHLAFKTTFIPFLAIIPSVFLVITLIFDDVKIRGMRVITTDVLLLLCLSMLPVLLVGAIPYQPWMTPVGAFILIGDMIMTQAVNNAQKRLAPENSEA